MILFFKNGVSGSVWAISICGDLQHVGNITSFGQYLRRLSSFVALDLVGGQMLIIQSQSGNVQRMLTLLGLSLRKVQLSCHLYGTYKSAHGFATVCVSFSFACFLCQDIQLLAICDIFSPDVYERLLQKGKKPGFLQLLATQTVSAVWHVSVIFLCSVHLNDFKLSFIQ